MSKGKSYQYIWNIKGNRRFIIDSAVSPYMEVNEDFINGDILESGEARVNPFIRFNHIFCGFLNTCSLLDDSGETEDIRGNIVHNALLFLQKLDFLTGTTIVDIYCEKILKDLENGVFGEGILKYIKKLSPLNKKTAALVIYSSITANARKEDAFIQGIKIFFKDSIIYRKLDNTAVVYLNYPKTAENKSIVGILRKMFLKMDCSLKCCWKNHFGVVGVKETGRLGEMTLF